MAEKKYVIVCEHDEKDTTGYLCYLNIHNHTYCLVETLEEATIFYEKDLCETAINYWDYFVPFEVRQVNGVRYWHRLREVDKLKPKLKYFIARPDFHYTYKFLSIDYENLRISFTDFYKPESLLTFDTEDQARYMLDKINDVFIARFVCDKTFFINNLKLTILKGDLNSPLYAKQNFELIYSQPKEKITP